jgi:hypothetical protein
MSLLFNKVATRRAIFDVNSKGITDELHLQSSLTINRTGFERLLGAIVIQNIFTAIINAAL